MRWGVCVGLRVCVSLSLSMLYLPNSAALYIVHIRHSENRT